MKIKSVQLGKFTQKPIELTQDQLFSPEFKNIPTEDSEYFLSLYDKCEKQPKKVYNALLDFLKKHHILPEALSLLSYIYIQRRKVKRADEMTEFNYKHNPDNLLAKINYADLCLRNKESDVINEIFEDKFDLVDLYPERELFQFNEYRGFHVLLGHYFLDLKERELAEGHLILASNIAPKHPSVLFLASKLYKKKKKKLFSKST